MSLLHRLKACGGKSDLQARIEASAWVASGLSAEEAGRRLLDGALLRDWPAGLSFGLPDGRLGAGSRLAVFAFGSWSVAEVARVGPGAGLWLRFAGGALAGTCEVTARPEGEGCRVEFKLRAEPVSLWLRSVCALTEPGAHLSRWALQGLTRAL